MNETMMQAFYWGMNEDEFARTHPEEAALWVLLGKRAQELSELGITALWMPPANKCCGGIHDVGYGTYDLWDLGEFDQKGTVRTKYGTKEELLKAADLLHQCGIKLYYDAVLNHRLGADETETVILETGTHAKVWTKFTFPGRGDKYSPFKWDTYCFDGIFVNDGRHEPKVYLFKDKQWDGTFDQDYIMGADLDYGNSEVRKDVLNWARWIIRDIGFDGFRLDAVKHIDNSFIKELINFVNEHAQRKVVVFGEAWLGSEDELVSYLESVGHPDLRVLDFSLRNRFTELMNGTLDMRWLGGAGLVNREGYRDRAITFVDNHDTDRTGDNPYGMIPILNRKYQAYTYILMREHGIPIVFWKDFYVSGMKEKLQKLLEARKKHAYGAGFETDTNDHNTYSYIRAGSDAVKGSGLVMMITQEHNNQIIVKRINSRKPNTTFGDCTGNIPERVTTDEHGFGDFTVKGTEGEGYSVWVPV